MITKQQEDSIIIMHDENLTLASYYRLKYFYFINPEDVAKDAFSYLPKFFYEENKKRRMNWSPQGIATLFESILYVILKHTSPYTDYLAIEGGQKAFFGENLISFRDNEEHIEYYKIIRNAFRFSILHHCIIQSLYKNLAKENINTPTFNMKAGHYSRFQRGYFEQCDGKKKQ